jgi:hypothetical protein
MRSFLLCAASLDQDKRPTMLTRPDGKVFEKEYATLVLHSRISSC